MNMVRNPRVAIVPRELEGAQMARGAARIRPGEGLDNRYLLHWLTSGTGQRWLLAHMRGIDMPGLNLRDVRRMPVPLPPLSKQQRLANYLDKLSVRTNAVTAQLESALADAKALETLLVASLAYGRLGGATSEMVLGPRVSTESVHLRERLQLMKSEASSTRSLRREASSVDGELVTGAVGKPVDLVSDDIVSALEALGRSAAPEDLYRRLKLSESLVDVFYIELRKLIESGTITEIRPNTSDVILRVAGSH